jgi:phosphoribosylanthranilate isomerase
MFAHTFPNMPTIKNFARAGLRLRTAFYGSVLTLCLAADLTAGQQTSTVTDTPTRKTVLSPEKAGKAEGAATDYSRKAVICEWLGFRHTDNSSAPYAELMELYKAAAEQKWRVWQAHHFDNPELLKQAETEGKPLFKQVQEKEKALKALELPRPELKALDVVDTGRPEQAAKISSNERAAMNCARQAHIHAYNAERRIDDRQPYHAAMAEGYAALAEQHWQVWRACHVNDIETMVKAQANVKILQDRLRNSDPQNGKPGAGRRLDSALIANSETIAVNHGMLAVKCGQMAMQASADLKKIYLDLADNYRESSQLSRKIAAAAAGMDDGAVATLKIKLLTLRDTRQTLLEQEKKCLDDLKNNPEQAEMRRKIAELKRDYEALRQQVAKIKDAD